MPNGFARAFYLSPEWRKCRADFLNAKGGLCERCAASGLIVPATEVHHKVRITPDNLRDPSITLNFSNLEALCKECHMEEHNKIQPRTDKDGHADIDALFLRRKA